LGTSFDQPIESPPEPSEPPVKTADQKELLEEMRVAQLMIDDPEAFEQEMIDSQIGQRVTDAFRAEDF
jgi:hypothetical protein